MTIIIIITVLIIFLVGLFIFRRRKPNDKLRRKKYNDLYNLSNGSFDLSARLALDEIGQIKTPIAEDRFRAGNIVEYNIMQGDVRANPDLINTVYNRYGETLNAILQEDNTINNNIPRRFMIDRIADFDDNLNLNVFDDLLTSANQHVLLDDIKNRKQNAVINAQNKQQATNNYFKSAQTYTYDPQNVHDSSVSKDLRNTHDKINGNSDNSQHVFDEIKKFIKYNYSERKNATKVKQALATLDKAAEGNETVTLNSKENIILADVWNRSKHPGNIATANKMQESVIDSLVDCWEGSPASLVCINGRCARYLASMVTLDYDEKTGDVKTKEAYKNEIMSNAAKILEREITIAMESPNDQLRNVGDSYKDKNIVVDPQTEREFITTVKKEVDLMLDSYKDKLTTVDITNLRTDIYAGLE